MPLNTKCFLPFTLTLLFNLLLLGCSGSSESTDSNSNSNHSIEELDRVIASVTPSAEVMDIKPNDLVVYESNYQVELSPAVVVARSKTYVRKLVEHETYFDVQLINEDETLVSGGQQGKVVVTEENLLLAKPEKALLPQSKKLKSFKTLIEAFNKPLIKVFNENRIKILDLEVNSVRLPWPPLIRERMGCRGDGCDFKANKVSFIVEIPDEENGNNKIQVERIYIPGAPLLHEVFSGCVSQLVEIENRDFFVRQCTYMKDASRLPGS